MNNYLTSCTVAIVCSPNGPGTPFGSPILVLFDTLRFLCIVSCLVTLAMTPKVYHLLNTSGQRARVHALILFMLQGITTESEHLGDYASARLAFNLAAAGWALYGMWQMRREYPAKRRRTKYDPPPTDDYLG